MWDVHVLQFKELTGSLDGPDSRSNFRNELPTREEPVEVDVSTVAPGTGIDRHRVLPFVRDQMSWAAEYKKAINNYVNARNCVHVSRLKLTRIVSITAGVVITMVARDSDTPPIVDNNSVLDRTETEAKLTRD